MRHIKFYPGFQDDPTTLQRQTKLQEEEFVIFSAMRLMPVVTRER